MSVTCIAYATSASDTVADEGISVYRKVTEAGQA